jgi:2-succinyl-6-hydroxy-2,4-cyclohexadiene-1-carboxylate synthase
MRTLTVGPQGERLRLTLLEAAGGERPWLLCLHGFTGTARTWRPFARRFGRRFRLALADAPGHGASDAPQAAEPYSLWRTAERLAEALDRLTPGRPAHVLGYSMGGRQALHLALSHGARVASLALEGASPGIEDAAERAARQTADEALAEMIEREGLPAFVDHWQALPLFAGQAAMAAPRRARLRRERLGQRPEGLAMSLRGAGAGGQDDLWPRLSALAMPVLFVAGQRDERYAAIGRRLVAAVADGRLAIVPRAGHSAHLERPLGFRRALEAFWDEIGVRSPP